ncbi:hypothetical protein ANRL1_04260 [Anaerolineae bacterium]|nr:hypothetical protein ANRL1_04260 [Anaerolineae bacterium]
MASKVVGGFTLEDGILSGPQDYMEEHDGATITRCQKQRNIDAPSDTLVDWILAGEDTIFNMTNHQSPDIETAILVRLQTDYAGWLGLKQAEGYILSADEGWLKNG